MMVVGEFAYLARTIIEPACEDHPDFLMGVKGEKVKILGKDDAKHFPYLIEALETNPGNPWRCSSHDLMRTKPFSFN